MTEQEYLQNRVANQQEYFSKTATVNKKRHFLFSVVKLAISLVITVASLLLGDGSISSIIIAILSAIAALIDGIMLLYKFSENWMMNRISSEKIKQEKMFYLTKTAAYQSLDTKTAFSLFVQNIESIIMNSNERWESLYKKGGED